MRWVENQVPACGVHRRPRCRPHYHGEHDEHRTEDPRRRRIDQEVQIGQWLKQEGDRVDADENVVELETDKATLELPAPAAGVIRKILKHDGDAVAVGETIAHLDRADDAEAKQPESEAPKEAGRQKPKEGESKKPEHAAEEADQRAAKREARPESRKERETERKSARPAAGDGKHKAEAPPPVTPSGRRALLEFGLRAEDVHVRGDRIRREDVLRTVEERKAQAAEPQAEVAKAAEAPPKPREAEGKRAEARPDADESLEDVVPMSLIRRRIAERLVEAQQTAALLTTFNEIDMSAVIALRKEHGERFQEKYGVKLGFMSFFVKATIDALKEYPELNAEIRGTDIVYRNYYDIGIAIGSEQGAGRARAAARRADELRRDRAGDRRLRRPGRGQQADARRAEGRHVHDHQRRRLRLAALDADRQPAAKRRPGHARDPGPAGRSRGPGRHPADDVRRPDLRSPPGRRPRSGIVLATPQAAC